MSINLLDAHLTLDGIGGVEKYIEASLQHIGKEYNDSPGFTTLALGLHACMKNTLGRPCNVGMSATSDMRVSSLHAFLPWLSHRNPPLISPIYMNSELYFSIFSICSKLSIFTKLKESYKLKES